MGFYRLKTLRIRNLSKQLNFAQQTMHELKPMLREINGIAVAFFDEVGGGEVAGDGVGPAVVLPDGAPNDIAVNLPMRVALA